jgi:molybdopterin-guanine dinucleotide biosynthesis protein B
VNTPNPKHPQIISIVGKSDAGKTTLIEKMIPLLRQHGLRIATIKHDVHGFQMDREGKDSYRHKQAGSVTSLISSPSQIGMVKDVEHDHTLAELVALYLPDVDLVLTEGYKRESWPKIEIHRRALNRPLITQTYENLIAVVSDEMFDIPIPIFQLEQIDLLVQFLIQKFFPQ